MFVIIEVNKTGLNIGITIPLKQNVIKTEKEKSNKYQDLLIGQKKMWNPLIEDAVSKGFKEFLQ